MSDPFIGQIVMFGGNFAPRNWAFCNGQLLAISSNTALFSILGTIYGGDGRTTFALPDLRGRVAVSSGTGPGLPNFQLGSRGGTPEVTLNSLEIPAHNHSATATANSVATMRAESRPGNATDPTGLMLASGSSIFRRNVASEDVAMDAAMVSVDTNVNVQTGLTGGNRPHTNLQPFQTVNYIIALFGVFPSRN